MFTPQQLTIADAARLQAIRTSDVLALTGTAYGEIRGGTDAQVQNQIQCVLNRFAQKWQPSISDVCFAYEQFSCWNANDPNRLKILHAYKTDPVNWNRMYGFAHLALLGKNPNRIATANSYFAASMSKPPYWAIPPAFQTYYDGAHRFWHVPH